MHNKMYLFVLSPYYDVHNDGICDGGKYIKE